MCQQLGMNAEEHIPWLHWMVHALVHIQQKNVNVKCRLSGRKEHFLKRMFWTKPCDKWESKLEWQPVLQFRFRGWLDSTGHSVR